MYHLHLSRDNLSVGTKQAGCTWNRFTTVVIRKHGAKSTQLLNGTTASCCTLDVEAKYTRETSSYLTRETEGRVENV